MITISNQEQLQLLDWYARNQRDLPWRRTRDAYRIWISEIMLQQTTSTAVIPYFERFLSRFQSISNLAEASIEEVYEMWAGLGYYSRARNLHATAKWVAQNGGQFPNRFDELIKLKGMGPYTARAVASFAFGEGVGVLDGNVIRFLTRYKRLALEWWRPKERAKLQVIADFWVQNQNSHDVNQALIEIGATICTSKSPKCMICPLIKTCKSVGRPEVDSLPLKKPRRAVESWVWQISILKKGNKFGLIENSGQLPVLKNQLIWPGRAKKVKNQPKTFAFSHVVTHHNIYVQIMSDRKHLNSGSKELKIQWLDKKQLKQKSPMSLVTKALNHI